MTAEVLDKFAQLITTALGLVAALAWNAAIQALFTKLFGEAGAALIGQFVYAVLITLVVIFATIAVSRAAALSQATDEDVFLLADAARRAQQADVAGNPAPILTPEEAAARFEELRAAAIREGCDRDAYRIV